MPRVFAVGDLVRVIDGPWVGKRGIVTSINSARNRLTAWIDHFGRLTQLELEFELAEKLGPDAWDDEMKKLRKRIPAQ